MSYTYHLRPGYGSDKMLVEFLGDNFETPLLEDLLEAFRAINPRVASVADSWLHDEIACIVDSDQGPFTYSKDSWGFAFLVADDNQTGLLYLAACLVQNALFTKVEVDFTNYK